MPDAVDRRTFVKEAALASAAAYGSRVLLPTAVPSLRRDVVWRPTPCRLCGMGCGLLVAVENGRAVAVRGDPDSPVSRGLACVKGYHAVQALYGRDRITRAMVRRDGKLAEVPLAVALDLVAQRIRDTVARHGKDGVALYGSAQWTVEDAVVAERLFGRALGTSHVDTSARLASASAAAGLRSTFGLDGAVGCYEDVDHADVFVLWDGNLAETDPVLFSRMLARRRTNPAVKIVVLSTRATRTSYAADRALLHAPQTELAIANALCNEIVARSWVDRAFVDRYVAFKRGRTGLGVASSRAVVDDVPVDASWKDYEHFLSAYTPEAAQRLSGVPADDVRWLASLYADRARRVMTVWGAGANQHVRGTWLNNLLFNVHLLVGKIASPGNAAFGLTGQPGGGGGPDASPATSARRHDALATFHALERGDVRFLWIQAANPMASLPNVRRWRRALEAADRFVVVSEAYPTASTEVADVVLPAALWLEREGVYINPERRAQHFAQMLQPPGDATTDAAQMIEVARRLGHTALVPWDPQRHVEATWDEYRRAQDDPRRTFVSLAELRARPGVLWPVVKGRETRWRYNGALDPDTDRELGAFDFYGHRDRRAWIWLRPYEPAAEVPDAEYPFWLSTGAVLEHCGTGALTRRIPTLRNAMPHAYVEMHRDDAARLGIRDRDRVRLASRRGAIELEARIDFRSQPARGQLFAPSFDESVPVNALTLDACDPLSGQPDTGKCAVRVERIGGRGGVA